MYHLGLGVVWSCGCLQEGPSAVLLCLCRALLRLLQGPDCCVHIVHERIIPLYIHYNVVFYFPFSQYYIPILYPNMLDSSFLFIFHYPSNSPQHIKLHVRRSKLLLLDAVTCRFSPSTDAAFCPQSRLELEDT